jgi:hypothetical protein
MQRHQKTQTNNNINADQRPKWFISDDLCESSFKLSVRFGASWLRAFMQFLAIASLITNVVLVALYKHETAGAILNHLSPTFSADPESRLLLDVHANQRSASQIAEIEGDQVGGTATDDIIEQPPLPYSNSTVINEPIVYSIRSTNKIIADEKRETRKKRRSLRKAKREFIEPKSTGALSPKANFAACLLVKDDNDILSEWIAYHYHSLNMRFLIVAVDPHSAQSPSSILARWKLLTDLDVIEWKDEMYMPPYFLQNGHAPLQYLSKMGKEMDLQG